ncbi:hypothetical protein LFREDSHE_44740 [Shewanella baltica]
MGTLFSQIKGCIAFLGYVINTVLDYPNRVDQFYKTDTYQSIKDCDEPCARLLCQCLDQRQWCD